MNRESSKRRISCAWYGVLCDGNRVLGGWGLARAKQSFRERSVSESNKKVLKGMELGKGMIACVRVYDLILEQQKRKREQPDTVMRRGLEMNSFATLAEPNTFFFATCLHSIASCVLCISLMLFAAFTLPKSGPYRSDALTPCPKCSMRSVSNCGLWIRFVVVIRILGSLRSGVIFSHAAGPVGR